MSERETLFDARDVEWLIATCDDVLARPEEPYLGRMRDALAAVKRCGWTSPSGTFVCVKQAGHTGNHGTVRQ